MKLGHLHIFYIFQTLHFWIIHIIFIYPRVLLVDNKIKHKLLVIIGYMKWGVFIRRLKLHVVHNIYICTVLIKAH